MKHPTNYRLVPKDNQVTTEVTPMPADTTSIVTTPRNYRCGIFKPFTPAVYLAGDPKPMLADYLRAELMHVYGDRFEHSREMEEALADLNWSCPHYNKPRHSWSSTGLEVCAKYERDLRSYTMQVMLSPSFLSLIQLGEWCGLSRGESQMLRAHQHRIAFIPDQYDRMDRKCGFDLTEQDGGNSRRHEPFHDWCEETLLHLETAMEHTLYLFKVGRYLRLPRGGDYGRNGQKLSYPTPSPSARVLARICPEWGTKTRTPPTDVSQRTWENATVRSTNREIQEMMDKIVVITAGDKSLLMSVKVSMETQHGPTAPDEVSEV